MQTPISCSRCDACVQVTKHSWEHTSIQWEGRAGDACPQIAASAQGHPARVPGCPVMDETIRAAVRAGRIPVGGGDVPDVLPG